jgi:hypothetical protein
LGLWINIGINLFCSYARAVALASLLLKGGSFETHSPFV